MTILQALAILEAGVLECKRRNIDTPEMRLALTCLKPHIQPAWLIPQCAEHALAMTKERALRLRKYGTAVGILCKLIRQLASALHIKGKMPYKRKVVTADSDNPLSN